MSSLKVDFFLASSEGLNHFGSGSKMKKLFPHRKSKLLPSIEHPDHIQNSEGPTGHTLDRIVNAKEEARKKWVEEQEDFRRKRREHEMQMIAMEEAEVNRREEEVRRRNDDLDDKRRKNRMVQEAVAAQMRTLQEKLDEYRLTHKSEEEAMEDDIAALEDTLSEVKVTLERRRQALEQEEATPTAPQESPTTPEERNAMSMYPTLSVGKSEPKLNTNFHFGVPTPTRRNYNSSGSSPQTSHTSSVGGGVGSRSITPKTDTSSDFDTSV